MTQPNSRRALPKVGISACLLGEPVRYDGDHRRRDGLLSYFDGRVEWVPVCPEVELGMGVPREPIELVLVEGALQLLGSRTQENHTDAMGRWASARLSSLKHISGFVLKSRSPSCGPRGVPARHAASSGRGLFAAALIERFPDLPVAEDERLGGPEQFEDFERRLTCYAHLREMFRGAWSRRDVEEFHARHKLLARRYDTLESLPVELEEIERREFSRRYVHEFMDALNSRSFSED